MSERTAIRTAVTLAAAALGWVLCAWLLIDSGAGRATFRRVPYAVEQTQSEIYEEGLPLALAVRLTHGI